MPHKKEKTSVAHSIQPEVTNSNGLITSLVSASPSHQVNSSSSTTSPPGNVVSSLIDSVIDRVLQSDSPPESDLNIVNDTKLLPSVPHCVKRANEEKGNDFSSRSSHQNAGTKNVEFEKENGNVLILKKKYLELYGKYPRGSCQNEIWWLKSKIEEWTASSTKKEGGEDATKIYSNSSIPLAFENRTDSMGRGINSGDNIGIELESLSGRFADPPEDDSFSVQTKDSDDIYDACNEDEGNEVKEVAQLKKKYLDMFDMEARGPYQNKIWWLKSKIDGCDRAKAKEVGTLKKKYLERFGIRPRGPHSNEIWWLKLKINADEDIDAKEISQLKKKFFEIFNKIPRGPNTNKIWWLKAQIDNIDPKEAKEVCIWQKKYYDKFGSRPSGSDCDKIWWLKSKVGEEDPKKENNGTLPLQDSKGGTNDLRQKFVGKRTALKDDDLREKFTGKTSRPSQHLPSPQDSLKSDDLRQKSPDLRRQKSPDLRQNISTLTGKTTETRDNLTALPSLQDSKNSSSKVKRRKKRTVTVEEVKDSSQSSSYVKRRKKRKKEKSMAKTNSSKCHVFPSSSNITAQDVAERIMAAQAAMEKSATDPGVMDNLTKAAELIAKRQYPQLMATTTHDGIIENFSFKGAVTVKCSGCKKSNLVKFKFNS